ESIKHDIFFSHGCPIRSGLTERFDHTARSELGRSMVEMLGTLAIMGVLTIGGVAGYRYAINKSNANTILNTVSQMAIVASAELTTGGAIHLGEWSDSSGLAKIGGQYPVSAEYDAADSYFDLIVSGINDEVCERIKGMDWKVPYEIAYNGSVDGTCSAGENNEIDFAFAKTLNKNDVKVNGGSGDDTTPPEEDIVCDAGYYLDGTECQLCAAGTYAAAGANSCTTCPANTYSSAGAAACTDCPSDTISMAGSTSVSACIFPDCPSGYQENDYCGNYKGLCDSEGKCKNPCPENFHLHAGGAKQLCSCFGRSASTCHIECLNYDYTSTFYTIATGAYWCGTCLTGDTLILMSNGTTKRIDQIFQGDKVLSINPETDQLEEDEVTYSDAWDNKTHTEYDIWIFNDGTQIKTVHQHRFYNIEQQKMVYMQEWKMGEHAYNSRGEIVALISHQVVKEKVNHYTIFTKKWNNYFANGLLSGNRQTPDIHLRPKQ
ncbi:MAG: hypothetical protein IJV07_05340, partial [Alphaproteobacteria bacterium]|nr:hypothetical protein [Alphaproteobacteria bacterium]